MKLGEYRSAALRLATNLRGWKTKRKLLVIESDDWGAIRMPSKDTWDSLLAAGIRVDQSKYDSLDCLETREDVQALMNVIDTHRDASGRPALFTFNTIMGNPDFDAIERDDFQRFHHQHFFDSYRFYSGEDLRGDWMRAIEDGLIRAQFHGREHLNSLLWMTDLKAGHREVRLAFGFRFYGLQAKTSSSWQRHYKAAFSAESNHQLQAMNDIALDGLTMFERTFGYPSKTFVACNYVLPSGLEQHLSKQGIDLLQTQRGYMEPMPECGGKRRVRYRRTGQKNKFGQRYGVRNVLFEPYLDQSVDWSRRALREVGQAFRFGTPAIVCSHRVNYVSGMDIAHRDRNLKQLDSFLAGVRKSWPDVEFISSCELSGMMRLGS